MFLWCVLFLFKKKTAYEMRISDWSADVCSSDLERRPERNREPRDRDPEPAERGVPHAGDSPERDLVRGGDDVRHPPNHTRGALHGADDRRHERTIGRASWRDRVGKYV